MQTVSFVGLVRTASVVAVLAVPLGARSQAVGRINIIFDKPSAVQFTPDIKVLPGEAVTITTSGTVDVDHHYWNSRECDRILGIETHCWYEQRESGSPVGADGLDLQARLASATDVAIVKKDATTYELYYPLNKNLGNFAASSGIEAMFLRGGIHRNPCVERPDHCGSGDLTLTLQFNVRKRLDGLRTLLTNQSLSSFDPTTLLSGSFIDAPLRDSKIAKAEDIKELASILTATAQRFFKEAVKDTAGKSPLLQKVIDMSAFAAGLSPIEPKDLVELRLLVLNSYLERGEYAQASSFAPTVIGEAKANFKSSPSTESALAYARAIRGNAIAWREKRAKNNSSDVQVSIALLDNAAALLWDYTDAQGISGEIAQINVDAARSLSIFRTAAELLAAERKFEYAVCFQMHADQDVRVKFDDWRKGELKNAGFVDDCQRVVKPT